MIISCIKHFESPWQKWPFGLNNALFASENLYKAAG